MKIIDTLILIAAVWIALKGYKHGLFDEVFHLLAIIAGAWAAVYGNKYVAEYIFLHSATANILSVVCAFALAAIAVIFIGKLCQSIFNGLLPSILNNMLGALFGIITVLFSAGLLFGIADKLDPEEHLFTSERKQASICYAPAIGTTHLLVPKLKEITLLFPKENATEEPQEH